MNFRLASFVFLPLAIFACSSTSSSGSGGGGGSDTPCGRYYNALTAFASRCGEVTGFEGTSNAVARFESTCNTAAAAPGAAGFLSALDACVTKVGALGCNDDLDCTIGGGTLEDGAACQESYQCKGYCKSENGGCGKCTALTAIGAACQSNGECGPTAHCEFGTADTGKCEADTKKAAGAACDTAAECGTGLVCVGGPGGKCAAPLAIGATCKNSNECGPSAACSSEKCAALPGEGAACDFVCAQGLGCGVDQKCAKRDFVGVGASCDSVHLCKDSICVGSSVSVSSGNGTDTKITQTPGRCQVPLADGAACKSDESTGSCDVFAKCTNGTCQVENPATCK